VNENSVDFTTVWKLCLNKLLDFQLINECKDNCNQASAQQSILTELIISKKWFIKANPGVKNFAQAKDRTRWPPSSQPVVMAMSYNNPKLVAFLKAHHLFICIDEKAYLVCLECDCWKNPDIPDTLKFDLTFLFIVFIDQSWTDWLDLHLASFVQSFAGPKKQQVRIDLKLTSHSVYINNYFTLNLKPKNKKSFIFIGVFKSQRGLWFNFFFVLFICE